MTTFLKLLTAFKLIHQTFSQITCLGTTYDPSVCNGFAGCIWVASEEHYMEGDCYPDTDSNVCDEFFWQPECQLTTANCCWYEFEEGYSCTGDCGGPSTTPSPVTPAPITNQIGDYCYCEIANALNVTSPTAAPSPSPTKSPTTPGTKKKKDKTSSGECAINGVGDCCCNKDFGQQTLTFVNLDSSHRTIESMRWWFDGQNSDLNDIMCEFQCIDYGETRTCNISGWDYTAGGNTRRKDGYDSFETNTYFDIIYVGSETCYSYFHTSCSSDIVGYFDAKDTNVCGVKCTAWTDANPNRISNCNDAQEPCPCANGTLAPVPTATGAPSQSPTVFINSICIPTVNPTTSPTNNPIIQPTQSPIPTQSPSDAPSSETNEPTIQPSEAPTRTRAPSGTPTSYTNSPTDGPTHISNMPSISSSSPTSNTNSPSGIPTDISLAPVTAQPSSSPNKTPTSTPSDSPSDSPTEFITSDSNDNKGKGKGLGSGGNGSDNMTVIIGGLIGGIIGAFLLGALCAGIIFWKYKKNQENTTTSNFKAQDEHMQYEVEMGNENNMANVNPMFTNNNNSFDTYK